MSTKVDVFSGFLGAGKITLNQEALCRRLQRGQVRPYRERVRTDLHRRLISQRIRDRDHLDELKVYLLLPGRRLLYSFEGSYRYLFT